MCSESSTTALHPTLTGALMRLDNNTNESFLSEQARGVPVDRLLAAP